MNQQLAEQVAFVTDGWQGLGSRVSDSLLARGVTVGVGYHGADPVVEEFATARADSALSFHQGSLARAGDCQRAVDELVCKHGRLDIVVCLLNFHPAGIFSTRRSLCRLSDREWRRTVEVNMSGAWHMARAALKHMVPARSGRIVFVLGVSGVADGQGHYATIRASVRALTRELAREVANVGITVNCVSTGAVRHEMLDALPPQAVSEALRRIPVGRLGEMSEITRVIEFLVDPDSGYLTGQIFAVDGGLTLDSI